MNNAIFSRAYSAYCRFVLTLVLVLYAFVPVQTFRIANIVFHFVIHIIWSSSLALGDEIIQLHCSNGNILPKGTIYRSLNSFLSTVFSGVMPLFVVSTRSSKANPHKSSKSRRMHKFGKFVVTEMMHMEMELEPLNNAVSILVDNDNIIQQRKNASKERKFGQRKSWAAFRYNLNDRQFQRYFQISKECFELLCDRIRSNVGEREFKSEVYLKHFRHTDLKSTNILRAHE